MNKLSWSKAGLFNQIELVLGWSFGKNRAVQSFGHTAIFRSFQITFIFQDLVQTTSLSVGLSVIPTTTQVTTGDVVKPVCRPHSSARAGVLWTGVLVVRLLAFRSPPGGASGSVETTV